MSKETKEKLPFVVEFEKDAKELSKKDFYKKHGNTNWYDDCNPTCYASKFILELEGKTVEFVESVIKNMRLYLDVTPIPLNDEQ